VTGRSRSAGPGEILDRRTLNRTLLERQLLLHRSNLSATEVIRHLVGMQAQEPQAPYVGLWTRVEGFRPTDLGDLITHRAMVRTPLFRNTLHLVTAEDCLRLRPVMQPVMKRHMSGSPFARHLQGIDLDELLAAGRTLLEEHPRSLSELGRLLLERWPDRDRESLAYGVRHLLPVVQVPPRGLWGSAGRARWAPAEHWLGKPLRAKREGAAQMILRYLAAFGPATRADIQAWSGLTGVREVVDRLRRRVRAFRDERGRELFDLPDATVADPDRPASPRFLPEFDNAILSHADRTRIVSDDHRRRLYATRTLRSFVVDGFIRGTWSIKRHPNGAATLLIEPFEPLSRRDAAGLTEEGHRLLSFVAGDDQRHHVRIATP
jgi:choline dehydrogenase-like flavoprotein